LSALEYRALRRVDGGELAGDQIMSATVAASRPSFGVLLRDWRRRRRLSQLDLALEAEVSSRHLSFVETGRAKPSRELVLQLAEQLGVPLRERNALLLAAGYAPVYRQTSFAEEEMSAVKAAIDQLLAGHEPFAALVVNKRWDVISANRPAMAFMTDGVSPALLEPPLNALRIALHPDGLAPRIGNLHEWSAHCVARLHRHWIATGDASILQLENEIRGYPGVAVGPIADLNPIASLFVPLVFRTTSGDTLRLFSTITTFGTALDITLEELAIESHYPADEATAALLHAACRRSEAGKAPNSCSSGAM
jgi:transcriptional regulator with XRE-family HTH domain